MNRRTAFLAVMALTCSLGMQCPGGGPVVPPVNSAGRVGLTVVKLTTTTTTDRGPAVGDGVIAFNALGNSVLAWIKVGETTPKEVPAPSGMDNDSEAFHFSGKKLVIRDRTSGSLYVFDTETETVKAMPSSSINMGSSIGPNLWEVDGNLVATINATVTTTDGAGQKIKIVNISDINNYVITPFTFEPIASISGVDIDTTAGRMIVRAGTQFFLYQVANPTAAPQEFTRGVLEGGTGDSDIQIQGNSVVFFDNDENFTLLDLSTGQFSQPARNPGRANRGVSFEESRFAFFAQETSDDGNSISVLNRCLTGTPTTLNSLVDPTGTFVNGEDATDGRVGFGAAADVSPDGKYVFVSGETIVDVSVQERLSVSTDGGEFKACVELADLNAVALNAIRASGASCSNNLVAWNYPIDPTQTFSSISVAYAVLPPP